MRIKNKGKPDSQLHQRDQNFRDPIAEPILRLLKIHSQLGFEAHGE